MSTKTLRKRIALATVAALGTGVLSLVSMPAAQAYASAYDNAAAGSTSTAASSYVLNIGTTANTTGSAVVPTTTSVTSLNGATQITAIASTAASSVGLVNVSDIAGGTVAGTTGTAVLLATGKLVVYTSLANGNEVTIVVSGGTLSSGTTNVNGINSGSTAISASASGSLKIGTLAAVVTPNSGVTSMTVSMYGGATSASVSNPTAGTLYSQYVVTIASTSTAGAVSTSKSGIYYAHAGYGGVSSLTADDTTAATEANPTGGTGAYGITQYANIRVRDAYGTAITSSTGLLSASATNGAYVDLAAGGANSTPYAASDFLTKVAYDNSFLAVTNPTSAPLTTVVTITYNGTVIGTKSFTFTGKVAKVTLTAATIGKTASTGLATISFADSAGNVVYPSASSTQYPATGLTTDGDTLNQYVISGAMGTNSGAKLWPTSSSSGYWEWTCVGTTVGAGSANVGVLWTNNDGSVVKSNTIDAKCAGSPYTYTAALDKASYAPGDIAKLTVTFKDSKGNLASDTGGSNYASTVAATTKATVDGGNLSLIGGTNSTTGLNTDSTTNGVLTYKFTVGSPTTDPYSGNLVVTFADVNANGVATAQTVSYKIVSGATSLNDVLKGIVSLIASINKQIAALAKLVTKKK